MHLKVIGYDGEENNNTQKIYGDHGKEKEKIWKNEDIANDIKVHDHG